MEITCVCVFTRLLSHEFSQLFLHSCMNKKSMFARDCSNAGSDVRMGCSRAPRRGTYKNRILFAVLCFVIDWSSWHFVDAFFSCGDGALFSKCFLSRANSRTLEKSSSNNLCRMRDGISFVCDNVMNTATIFWNEKTLTARHVFLVVHQSSYAKNDLPFKIEQTLSTRANFVNMKHVLHHILHCICTVHRNFLCIDEILFGCTTQIYFRKRITYLFPTSRAAARPVTLISLFLCTIRMQAKRMSC